MSINPLNDISKVYLEQVASVDEARSIEHMRDRYLKDPKEVAKQRAKNIADRRKKRAALAHMEKQYAGMKAGIYSSYELEGEMIEEKKKKPARWWDDDGDDVGYEEGEVSGKFKRKKKVEESSKPNDGNLANNYPPYDRVTRGDVIAGALGKDQMGGKKKKVTKEGYSNWREDLIEVVDKISKDKSADVKITEKQVDNKIDINPKLDLGETVENLGGTLLEMVEIDEVDFIVESVYDELLDEGYGEDDIEEALEYALIEAKVTFGHDTPTGQKKRGNLVAAVGRLARQKLSSKVRGAKKAAGEAVARGARKVAKGALGVARKMEGGDTKPSPAQTKTRSASTYRGAGAGTKERVSSGSYTPPTKKKAEKPADPWEGSATTPTKSKPKTATKKAAAPKPKAPAAAAPKRKRKSNLDSLLADIRNESVIGDRARNAVADDRLSSEQEKTSASMNRLRAQTKRHEKSTALARTQASIAAKKSEDTARAMHPKPGVRGHRIEEVQINEMPYQVMGSPDGKNEKKIGKPVKSRRYADARAAELEDTHKKTGGKYRSQYVEEVGMIDEKTLTAAEKAKKEEIFKSLKAKRKDFESRYPGRGEEVMHGVATNIAKKIAEQAMEIQPKSSQSGQKDQTQKKLAQQKDRQRQQEVQILQRKLQTLRSAPKGVDTDITA